MKKRTLLEELKSELMGEPAPEGWYNVQQLMELLGAKRTAVENFVERKGYEVRRFNAVSKDGKTMKMNHYKVGKL
jgi:hypothetical protein